MRTVTPIVTGVSRTIRAYCPRESNSRMYECHNGPERSQIRESRISRDSFLRPSGIILSLTVAEGKTLDIDNNNSDDSRLTITAGSTKKLCKKSRLDNEINFPRVYSRVDVVCSCVKQVKRKKRDTEKKVKKKKRAHNNDAEFKRGGDPREVHVDKR